MVLMMVTDGERTGSYFDSPVAPVVAVAAAKIASAGVAITACQQQP